MKELIEQLRNRIDLRMEQAREASRLLADPAVSELEKGDFLVALKIKGESGEELGYLARSFLEMAIRPTLQLQGKPSVDIVGTGGDRLELINVSTTCLFVLAAAGVVVLKHGNKAITSKSGAADVLENLGIPVACSPEQMADCIHETGIGFFFAPLYHPAFRLVAPIRKKLAEQGIATVFNLLGPLSNPAGVTRQMVGVFSRQWVQPLAQVLKNLGSEAVWVVHGSDGLDEITLTGPTFVAALENGAIRSFEVSPEDVGLKRVAGEALKGGDAAANAAALRNVLAGLPSPYRDVALFNAAAALVVAGRAKELKEGLALGIQSIDGGAAAERLKRLVEVSNN